MPYVGGATIGGSIPTEATDGLICDLDAGNASSYDSGVDAQRWFNLNAPTPSDFPNLFFPLGYAHNFLRGSNNTSQASDPTFNGTPGGGSSAEKWTFDGGDFFTMDDDADGTPAGGEQVVWQDFHKDNGAFTIVIWADIGTLTDSILLANTTAAGTNGFLFKMTSGGELSLQVRNASGDALNVTSSGLSMVSDDIAMLAVSIDESVGASGGLFFYNDGSKTTSSFTSTYTTPSTADYSAVPRLGADGGGSNPIHATFELFAMRVWNKALTEAELDTEFTRLQTRLGL